MSNRKYHKYIPTFDSRFKNSVSLIVHIIHSLVIDAAINFRFVWAIRCFYIPQDMTPWTHVYILEGFLATHCPINWVVFPWLLYEYHAHGRLYLLQTNLFSESTSFSYSYMRKPAAYTYKFFIWSILRPWIKWSDNIRLGTPVIILIIFFSKSCRVLEMYVSHVWTQLLRCSNINELYHVNKVILSKILWALIMGLIPFTIF